MYKIQKNYIRVNFSLIFYNTMGIVLQIRREGEKGYGEET